MGHRCSRFNFVADCTEENHWKPREIIIEMKPNERYVSAAAADNWPSVGTRVLLQFCYVAWPRYGLQEKE